MERVPDNAACTVSQPGQLAAAPSAAGLPRGHGSRAEKLLPALVELLAKGMTMKAAAEAVGIGERTAHRWQTLPRFQTLLAQERRNQFEEGAGSLIAKIPSFAEVLVKTAALTEDVERLVKEPIKGKGAGLARQRRREDIRLRIEAAKVASGAARDGLAQALKAIELLSLAGEVERLKSKLKEADHARNRKRGVKMAGQATRESPGPDQLGAVEGAVSNPGGPGEYPGADRVDTGFLAGEVAPLQLETDAGAVRPPVR